MACGDYQGNLTSFVKTAFLKIADVLSIVYRFTERSRNVDVRALCILHNESFTYFLCNFFKNA